MEEKEMIEEMASDMNFACIELSKEQRLEIARVLINLDYCKIPEGSVVLDRQEHQKYCAYKIIEPQIRGCLDRERELESENESCYEVLADLKAIIKQQNDRIAELEKENMILQGTKNRLTFTDRIKIADNARTIALKQFAERVKMEFYYEFDEIIPSIMSDKIDKILKELIGE